jgi:biopolymer transport protein ExbD
VDTQDYVNNATLNQWVEASSMEELAPFFAPETMGSEVITSGEASLPWRRSGESEEEVSFDLTPMIDTTFLLLTFFLATATFAVHQVKNVDIPKASYTQDHKQEKVSIVVTVDKDRNIYVGRKAVQLPSLKSYLKEEVSKTQQQDLVLTADHTLDYGFVVSVLDEINGAGIKNVKLKLEKKKQQSE